MIEADFWTWPWTATLDFWRRALASQEAPPEAEAPLPIPAWATPHRIALEIDMLRLVDFSHADAVSRPVAVIAPFALHDSALVDLAPGHSLIEALLGGGCARLFLVDWKSATRESRLNTIDTQLASLNVAIDEIGPPVDVVGLCQGGWLALVYAARFPGKIRRLALVGAPVDLSGEASALSAAAREVTDGAIDALIGLGGGLARGRHLAAAWPREYDEALHLAEALQFPGDPASPEERRVAAIFARWDRQTLDLPGPYYRQVFDWLYRENRLAAGSFVALGRRIDLSALRCPLYLLAGARDAIAPPGQVFAAAALVGTEGRDIERALAPCGHLALFVGRRTLREEWPRIAAWLRDSSAQPSACRAAANARDSAEVARRRPRA